MRTLIVRSIAACLAAAVLIGCDTSDTTTEVGRQRICSLHILTYAGFKEMLTAIDERDGNGGPLSIDVDTLNELIKHPSYRGGPSAPDNAAAYDRVRLYYKKLCDGRDLGPELFGRSGPR